MSERHGPTVLRRVGFAMVPVCILVLCLEILASILYQPPAYEAGGPLGWTVQPNLQDMVVEVPHPQQSFVVSTNADGLRSPHIRARQPGHRRVVTVGDSTVFGWGVSATETPAAILEAELTAQHGGAWEVVNAGQPGYSSEQMRRLTDALLPTWSPDGIVWFHPWHDVVSAPSDRTLLPPQTQGRRRSGSTLVRWLQDQRRYIRPSSNPLFPLPHHTWHPLSVRVPAAHRAENLRHVVDAASELGTWVMVVLLPNDRSLLDPMRAPLARELEALSASLGVVFLDLSQQPENAELDALTIPGDTGHFNAQANRLYMEHVRMAMPTQ